MYIMMIYAGATEGVLFWSDFKIILNDEDLGIFHMLSFRRDALIYV
jgi:hypothetical protein